MLLIIFVNFRTFVNAFEFEGNFSCFFGRFISRVRGPRSKTLTFMIRFDVVESENHSGDHFVYGVMPERTADEEIL